MIRDIPLLTFKGISLKICTDTSLEKRQGVVFLTVIVIYIIALVVYWYCPKYIKLVSFIANLFIPDPIPYLDEIVMVAGLLKPDE